MNKRTKGPWKFETDWMIYSENEEMTPVAKVYPTADGIGNAALLAAAPDLLEALEATQRVLQLSNRPELKEAFCRNAAAISKARGET